MRSSVPCSTWIAIFFTWHSSEHMPHLDVKWNDAAERPSTCFEQSAADGQSEIPGRCSLRVEEPILFTPSKFQPELLGPREQRRSGPTPTFDNEGSGPSSCPRAAQFLKLL